MLLNARWTAYAVLLLATLGCQKDKAALERYLSGVHPELTAGVPAVLQAFDSALHERLPTETRLQRLDQDVIAPYEKIIAGLVAHQPDREVVLRHHGAYIAAAQRQLDAFRLARAAVAEGRSLDSTTDILRATRGDFERWLTQIQRSADELGIALAPGP